MHQRHYIRFQAPPLPYLLECGRTDYQPGEQHPNRINIGVFDLLFIQSGTLYIGEESYEWTLSSGQMLLLRPDAWHYAVRPCDEATSFYWLHIQTAGSWQEADEAEAHLNGSGGDKRNELNTFHPYALHLPKYATIPYPDMVFALLSELLNASSAPRTSAFWQQQTAFVQLLQMLDIRQHEHASSPIVSLAERTEAYLKTHYRTKITNDALAQALHFHYNYITRCMKQVYGMTPMEYLHRYRLEQAKLLLLRTDWPVTVIAEQVGFDHAAYFTRRFTSYSGLSPRQYRQRYTESGAREQVDHDG